MLDVSCLFRSEGVENGFFVASRVQAALDADLLDQLRKPEAAGDNADRADDRAVVGVNLVRRAGQPVAARGGDINFAVGSRWWINQNSPLAALL